MTRLVLQPPLEAINAPYLDDIREIVLHDTTCPLDGQPHSTHRRCRLCGILVGPAHLEPVTYDGVCHYCQRRKP